MDEATKWVRIRALFRRWWDGIMKSSMPPAEKPVIVQNWVNWLNHNFGAGWFPLSGFHSLLLDQDKTKGIPVKAFWNTNTGEIKMFDARKFK